MHLHAGAPVVVHVQCRRSFRAADPEDLKKFTEVKLVTIDDPIFGGWPKVTAKHFADGGVFDQIYKPSN